MGKASRDKGAKKKADPIKQYAKLLLKRRPALRKQWLAGSWEIEEKPHNGKSK